MRIDGGSVYVLAYLDRKIRRGVRATASRAMGVTSVRVLRVRGGDWDVEVHRSGAWRPAEIEAKTLPQVLRDRGDAEAVRRWFESGGGNGDEAFVVDAEDGE